MAPVLVFTVEDRQVDLCLEVLRDDVDVEEELEEVAEEWHVALVSARVSVSRRQTSWKSFVPSTRGWRTSVENVSLVLDEMRTGVATSNWRTRGVFALGRRW